jgi:hypothetical protein
MFHYFLIFNLEIRSSHIRPLAYQDYRQQRVLSSSEVHPVMGHRHGLTEREKKNISKNENFKTWIFMVRQDKNM